MGTNRLNWTKMTATQQSVQVYGRKKTATAVAHCRSGQGLIKVNGKPLEQIEPKTLQYKLQEPVLVVGKERFAGIDIRPCERWRSHCANLRDSPGGRPGRCRLLPEVRGRTVETRNQGSAHLVRSNPFGFRSETQGVQEVRRSRRPRAIPKIVPLNICGA